MPRQVGQFPVGDGADTGCGVSSSIQILRQLRIALAVGEAQTLAGVAEAPDRRPALGGKRRKGPRPECASNRRRRGSQRRTDGCASLAAPAGDRQQVGATLEHPRARTAWRSSGKAVQGRAQGGKGRAGAAGRSGVGVLGNRVRFHWRRRADCAAGSQYGRWRGVGSPWANSSTKRVPPRRTRLSARAPGQRRMPDQGRRGAGCGCRRRSITAVDEAAAGSGWGCQPGRRVIRMRVPPLTSWRARLAERRRPCIWSGSPARFAARAWAAAAASVSGRQRREADHRALGLSVRQAPWLDR